MTRDVIVGYPANFEWHACHYEDFHLIVDDEYEWIGERWYWWKDKNGNIEKARMKSDIPDDHFYPSPETIREEDVAAFKEIEGNPYHQYVND